MLELRETRHNIDIIIFDRRNIKRWYYTSNNRPTQTILLIVYVVPPELYEFTMSILCLLLSLDVLKCWLIAMSDTRYIILCRCIIFVSHHAHYSWFDGLYFIICDGFALLCCWLSQRGFGCIFLSHDIVQVNCCIHYYCVNTNASLLMSFRHLLQCSINWFLGGGAIHAYSIRSHWLFLAMISWRAMLQASKHISLQLRLTATA